MLCVNFDVNKPSLELLRDLIFNLNGIRLPEYGVTFGPVIALDQRPDIECDENTQVAFHVDPSIDDRFIGNTGLLYRRLRLNELSQIPDTKIKVSRFPFQVYDILPQINAAYGTQLTEDDVINDTYNSVNPPWYLRAKPSSYCYFDEMPLSLQTRDIILDQPYLSGFNPYQETPNSIRDAVEQRILPGFEVSP